MGKSDDFESFYKHRMTPIYEKLLADGSIVSYGYDEEFIQTEKPGGLNMWYVTPGAAILDKGRIPGRLGQPGRGRAPCPLDFHSRFR